jgi:regulator of sigma E protease
MVFILNILIIILILGLIILVHELGHLIACKLTKVYVEEFAIGMGPKLYSRQIGETLYSLRLFPIGGFNKIKGEEYQEEEVEEDSDPRSLRNQKPLVKTFIYLSGVLMNILLAVIIFYITLATMSFQWPIDSKFRDFEPVFGSLEHLSFDEKVRYDGLLEDNPAIEGGLPEEGYIQSIDEEEIFYSYQISEKLMARAGEEATLEVCENENVCSTYTLNVNEDGTIGIQLFQNYIMYVQYEGWQKFFVGFLHIPNWGKLMGTAIGELFSEAAETGDYEQVTMSVAGPVGLYVIIDYVRDMGWLPLLDITANISLSIAFFNLLPIPALDGGRTVILLGEVITRRKMNRKLEAWAIHISFILLLLLMVVVLFKDVFYFERLRNLLS